MVLSDLERHCVVAVLAERSQKAFEAWLEGLSETELRAIRLVSMDMWGPYRGVVKNKLPWAEIVADRFHVMKQLNDAIAKIRRRLQAKADPATYDLLERHSLDPGAQSSRPETRRRNQAPGGLGCVPRVAHGLSAQGTLRLDRQQDPGPHSRRTLPAGLVV